MYQWKRVVTLLFIITSIVIMNTGCDKPNNVQEITATISLDQTKDKAANTSTVIPDKATNTPTVIPDKATNTPTVVPNQTVNLPSVKPDKLHAEDNDFYIVNGKLIHYYGNSAEIIIPDSVTEIGENAFCGRSEITSVTIPDTVISIDNSAFEFVDNLTSVTIPASVTQIGENCFYGCTNLADISILSPLVSIGAEAFSETRWLKVTQMHNDLIVLNHNVIDGTACKGIVEIPEGITSIADGAFTYGAITEITLPDTVSHIGKCAFYICGNLKKITIPDSITSIGEHAFFRTPWLENQRRKNPLVIINHILIDGVTCKGKVTIPEHVTRINDMLFMKFFMMTIIIRIWAVL
jgi:hypothetical protein